MKTVGIIGAGRIGQAMAQTALRAGRQVVIANSRGPESLASVVASLGDGVSAGTIKEAAAADIVVVAVMWPDVPKAVGGVVWEGQIVIDPTNDFDPSALGGRTSSEVFADLVARYPGMAGNLVDYHGGLHKFVNVYRNDDDIRYLEQLDTTVSDGDELSILPAVAGG